MIRRALATEYHGPDRMASSSSTREEKRPHNLLGTVWLDNVVEQTPHLDEL